MAFAFTAWDFLRTPTVSVQSFFNVPYADVSSIKATSSGLYLTVSLFGSSGFQPEGGSAVIIETGRSCSLTPVDGHLYGSIPLSPSYLGMRDVGVEGVVQGSFFGQPSQIHFFSVVPLDFTINVSVVGVSFSGGLLQVNISSSSPVPVVIGGFYNVSLVDDNTHNYVFNSVGYWNISYSVQAGVHFVTATFRPGETGVSTWLYSSGPLSSGSYTLYMPTLVTYVFPNANSTSLMQFYHYFEVRRG